MPSTGVMSAWNPGGYRPSRRRGRPATLIPAPARPPTGYYDPSIDAQVAAGARGLGDLRIDTDTGHRRGSEDLASALGSLDLSRGRAQENYDTATGQLKLGFQQLGRRQGEANRAHNVASQGLAEKAATIRAGNQGRQQTLLDRDRDRTFMDIATQRGLTQRGYDRQYGAGGDLDLGLARAEREQPLLEADANTLRLAQATAAGYVPQGAHWRFGPALRRRRPPRGGGRGEG